MVQLTTKKILILCAIFTVLFWTGYAIIKLPNYCVLYIPLSLAAVFALFMLGIKEIGLFSVIPVIFFGFVFNEFAPVGSGPNIFGGVAAVSCTAVFLFFYVRYWEVNNRSRRHAMAQSAKAHKELTDKNTELKASLENIEEQSRFQNVLLGMVQNLIEVLDANEVKNRLASLIEQSFPGVLFTIKSVGTHMDIFDHWVYQRKTPLLIQDVASEPRFPMMPRSFSWTSLLAAPIMIQAEVYEIIRLESREKGAFHMSHLRIIELLSLMTSIAIDNISLLNSFRDRAIHDGFTGLYNHKYFTERLEEEVLFAGRYRNNLGLIMIDIDHFKKFNDTYGHAAGDEVLKRLVQVLNSRVRDVDLVARYGGEEFCVLMPEVTRDELFAVAESIRLSFGEEPFIFNNTNTSATVSLGIAMFPKDASTAPQLVRWADQRLYQAKSQGRNRVIG